MGTRTHNPPALTEEAILATALGYVERGELDQMSIRRLASDLGVTPMALYRHVANKDAVLLHVTDALLARKRLPNRRLGWQAYLRGIAGSLRSLLVEHPELVAVFGRQPVITPTTRRRLTSSLEVLTEAGFSRQGAIEAFAAVHTYTVGFCALQAARASFQGPRAAPGDREAAAIRGFVSDRQFHIGLDAVLAGLPAATGS